MPACANCISFLLESAGKAHYQRLRIARAGTAAKEKP